MDVNGAGDLPAADVARRGQGAFAKGRRREQRIARKLEHIEAVLPLPRNVDPGSGRVEIEMTRPKAVAATRRNRGFVCQLPALVGEDLQRTGLLGLAGGGVVTAS